MTPENAIELAKREAREIAPITRRQVACFDHGADLAFHGLPVCEPGAIPDHQERRAMGIGYTVGLEMARQRRRERGTGIQTIQTGKHADDGQ